MVDDAEPVAVEAGEASVKLPSDGAGQVEAGGDDAPLGAGLRANSRSRLTETLVSTSLRPCTSSPSQTVNGLLNSSACSGAGAMAVSRQT
jgi:hypothetical protein